MSRLAASAPSIPLCSRVFLHFASFFSRATSAIKGRMSIVSAQRPFHRKQMTGRVKTMAKNRRFPSLKLIYVTIIFNNAKRARTRCYRAGGSSRSRHLFDRGFCRFCFFCRGLTRVDRRSVGGSSLRPALESREFWISLSCAVERHVTRELTVVRSHNLNWIHSDV